MEEVGTKELEHTDSLESRDNPFLPGGDLSREAEDLLSRATIIRDQFYLNEEEKKTLREQQLLQQQLQQEQQQQPPQKQPRAAKHVQIVDHHDGVNGHAPSAVEERISPQTVSNASAAPPAGDGHQSPKENGKVGDPSATTGASSTPAGPDSVHVTIPDGDGQPHNTSTTGPGGGGPNSAAGAGDLQVQDADKKRRNKCCAVM